MTAYFATYDRRVVEIPGIGSSDRLANNFIRQKKKK